MTEHNDADDEMKQTLVIRSDLELSAGKAAAQAAHASQWAADRADDEALDAWEDQLATKIVLGVDSEAELRDIAEETRSAGLPVSVVNDAGRTEVDEGTTTALGIGPAKAADIDALTQHLSLYR